MTVTDWTAISALILSAGATALVILNTRWLQEWKWKLDLLTERHREIEAVANEVDATHLAKALERAAYPGMK